MRPVVLVPTDFSEVCYNAVLHGAGLAGSVSGDLLILHVINKDTHAFLRKAGKNESHISELLEKLAGEVAEKCKVSVITRIRKGSIFSEIRKEIVQSNAWLMILGTHGKKGFQHLVGSAALRVIKGVSVPVVVVQNRVFGDGYKKIVLPVGLDTDFMQKLEWTVEMATIFDAEVLLFRNSSEAVFEADSIRRMVRLIKSKLELENIPYQEAQSGGEGSFAVRVLDFAKIHRADLVVILTETDELDLAFFTGTSNEKMIYNTPQIPVMCINPGK